LVPSPERQIRRSLGLVVRLLTSDYGTVFLSCATPAMGRGPARFPQIFRLSLFFAPFFYVFPSLRRPAPSPTQNTLAPFPLGQRFAPFPKYVCTPLIPEVTNGLPLPRGRAPGLFRSLFRCLLLNGEFCTRAQYRDTPRSFSKGDSWGRLFSPSGSELARFGRPPSAFLSSGRASSGDRNGQDSSFLSEITTVRRLSVLGVVSDIFPCSTRSPPFEPSPYFCAARTDEFPGFSFGVLGTQD